jgi:hypothetical protein
MCDVLLGAETVRLRDAGDLKFLHLRRECCLRISMSTAKILIFYVRLTDFLVSAILTSFLTVCEKNHNVPPI